MTRSLSSRSGFTLVEVMISSTLAAVILAAVMSTYLFLGRNLARLSSYQALETGSRKALAYLTRDFMQAESVKSGTTPTDSSVTLVLPSGEVSYTYDSGTKSLRRQATFGANPDLSFLRDDTGECTTFAFHYFTGSGGSPTDQVTATSYVPLSIKQIQVGYTVESPTTWNATTRTRYQTVSSRYVLRNRGEPNGS